MKRCLRTSARLVAATVLCMPHMASAEESDREGLTIEAQPLASALREFSEWTGLQIGYASELTDGKETRGVDGVDDPGAALDTLLVSTGLEHRFVNDETVVIRVAASVKEEGSSDPGNFRPASSVVLMAQNQTPAERTRRRDSSEATNEEDDDELPIENIIVTGTHIRGVDNVGVASITFTREELDATGFSTVEEFFEDLPQNLDEISQDGAFSDGASRIAGSNTQGAASISLRGLGPSSTLVLLNGRRRPGNIQGRVFDVSAIPLSMVERVEVVTGGRSAVYGSDAVAGVVNLVTRPEFDGAESQIYYGGASAGGERFNFNQTFGRTFEKGGFVVGYDYSEDRTLDATDTGALRLPSASGISPLPGLFWLRNPSEQHVGLFSGHFDLSGKAELYADAHYSSNENKTGGGFDFDGAFEILQVVGNQIDQYSASGGVRLDLGKNWQVDVSALHGVVDNATDITLENGPPGTFTSSDVEVQRQSVSDAKLTSFSAIADGPLREFGNGAVSAAIGVEYRDESWQSASINPVGSIPVPREDRDRDVMAMFGELYWPFLYGEGQRFEVSLAGRYDDYSDFGDTFNPQYGIEWGPLDGLTLRGTFSEAFRAPDLFTLAFGNQVVVQILDDPSAPGTPVTQFTLFGGNPNLEPELADTWTAGIDWHPSDGTKLSLSYYKIESSGRIDQPAENHTTALSDEVRFGSLINRGPTPEVMAEVLGRVLDPDDLINSTGVPFDPATDDPFALFSNVIVFDNRRSNIGLESIDGLDFEASTRLETSSGDWSFGVSGTYVMNFERNITETAPALDQINRPGRPVDLKLRGHVGWSRSAWNVNAFVYYADSYEDTLAATPTKIDSWTTVDLTVRFDASDLADSGFFDGFKATLGINNVLDEDPPVFLSNTFGLGFDTANSDALGRFVSLRLTKRW